MSTSLNELAHRTVFLPLTFEVMTDANPQDPTTTNREAGNTQHPGWIHLQRHVTIQHSNNN